MANYSASFEDHESIDTSLQFRGDVLLEAGEIPNCWGAMDLNELVRLFRRFGRRLMDPRIREQVEGLAVDCKELYANPGACKAIGFTGREVWFTCDQFAQEEPRPVKMGVKGLRLIGGGEYIASLSNYTRDFSRAYMFVRLNQIASTDELVDVMIRNAIREELDIDQIRLRVRSGLQVN